MVRKWRAALLRVRECPLDQPSGRSFLVKRLRQGAATYRVRVTGDSVRCDCFGHSCRGFCVHSEAIAALVAGDGWPAARRVNSIGPAA